MSKILDKDYDRYYVDNPGKGYNPARVTAMVEQTIKDNEELEKKIDKEIKDIHDEHADAAISYLRYADKGGSKDVADYFGRHEMLRLAGEKWLQRRLLKNNYHFMNTK